MVDDLISSPTGVDSFLNGTGQVTPLFYNMPCRAERTLIIADFARTEKLTGRTSMITIIADTSKTIKPG